MIDYQIIYCAFFQVHHYNENNNLQKGYQLQHFYDTHYSNLNIDNIQNLV